MNELQIQDAEEILCIYHFPCQDGFAAAWAMRHHMPRANIRFIPTKYGDPPPDVTGKIVYVLDFSYPREVVAHMIQTSKKFLLLDHHKTAMENLVGLDSEFNYKYTEGMTRYTSEKGHICLDMSRSGAGLAWDYFSLTLANGKLPRPRPKLIDHIEDRDLWRFNLKGTREIIASLFSFEYDFEQYDGLMFRVEPEYLHTEGIALMRKHMKDIRELLKIGTRPFSIGGHTVPCCNLPYTMSSEGGHELLKMYPDATFSACYMDQAHGRVFSLRSEDEREDVSHIARQYGGGGHRNAAGFTKEHGWDGDSLFAGNVKAFLGEAKS